MDVLTTQILVTIAAVIGTAGIWKFLETKIRLRSRNMKEKREGSDTVQFRDDLKERVKKLEDLLTAAALEKDDLRHKVLHLTEEVSTLRERVVHLEKDNDRLRLSVIPKKKRGRPRKRPQ